MHYALCTLHFSIAKDRKTRDDNKTFGIGLLKVSYVSLRFNAMKDEGEERGLRIEDRGCQMSCQKARSRLKVCKYYERFVHRFMFSCLISQIV